MEMEPDSDEQSGGRVIVREGFDDNEGGAGD